MRAVRWLIDTAGSITGTRFRLVIASSSTATALIIGSSLASGGDSGLASQLTQALAALGGSSSTRRRLDHAGVDRSHRRRPRREGEGSLPVSSVPVSSPSAAPTSTAKTPKTTTPKAGRVKHVFVITLNSPGYDNAFGAQSEMPYLANTLRPQGELLSNYSLLTDKGLPNYIGMIGGQSPNALTSGQLHHLHRLSREAPSPTATGTSPATAASIPTQAINVADQLFSARFNWGAYMEDMGKPEPVPQGETAPANPPQTCVHPDSGAADPDAGRPQGRSEHRLRGQRLRGQAQPVRRTSTPSSTWGAARRRTFRSTASTARSASGTPNFTFISPNLCNTGEPTECDADIKDPGPAQADKFLSDWVPKIQASPAYQQDGVLIITFGEADPGRQRGARRDAAALQVPDSGIDQRAAPSTRTPSSAPSRTSSASSISLPRLGRAPPSFASDLLGSQKKKKKKK